MIHEENGEVLELIQAMIITRPKKAIGLCKKGDNFYIKAYDIQKQKARLYQLQSIADEKNSKFIETVIQATVIEESSRTNVFYMASKNKFGVGDKVKTAIQVSALKMVSTGLEIQDYFALELAKYPEFKNVGSMKSLPGSNKQEFILIGGEGSVLVLKVSKNITFSELHVSKQVNTGTIVDVDLQGLTLMSCSETDKFATVMILHNSTNQSKQD